MAYRKGQLSFDFYVALVIFLGAVAYVVLQMYQATPATMSSLRGEFVRIEGYQVSELLVNDGGYPNGWGNPTVPLSSIRRIGLSDTNRNLTNLVSSEKIQRLKAICDNNYGDVHSLLGIKDGFSVTIVNHDTQEIVTCRPLSESSKRTSFNVSRIVSIDGANEGEIFVEVWQR